MLDKLDEIQKRKKGLKSEYQELALVTDSTSQSLVYIDKWLNSKDDKLIATATSFIDELGAIKPDLCTRFTGSLLELITNKSNRIVWGSLTALESYADLIHDKLYNNFNLIINALENGSVVAKDHVVQILQKLSKYDQYYKDCIVIMIEQIRVCAPNQLGQYSERCFDVIKQEDADDFMESLRLRFAGLDNHHHVRRIQNLLDLTSKKFNK
ncbi:hypothetical protein OAQ99_07640 [Candidatus Kapabacteria bacterium]|nr:hypothetical protein [Candidatus Kapabacteria bacterium]